jgi:hypothetical protein
VYAAGVVATAAVVTTRPMIATIVPGLVRGPRELAATNVAIGWLDGAATLTGPAITAVCIGAFAAETPFFVFAALVVLAVLLASRVPVPDRSAPRDGAGIVDDAEADRISIGNALAEVLRRRGLRGIVIVLASGAFVEGALDVLFVLVAIDVLGGTGAGAGWLNAAYGAGCLAGAATSVVLVGRATLWPAIVLGAGVAAGALTLSGVSDHAVIAALMFGVVGAGTSALVIAGRTLLQRVTDLQLLCHAFALGESSDTAMLLLGSMSVPLFVAITSVEWAAAGVAAVLVVVVAGQIRVVAAADRAAPPPIADIELLRSVDLFALLSAPALETLAREARVEHVPDGGVIIEQGHPGQDFYVLRSGSAVITRDGAEVSHRHPGQGFGELALLFDAPRTATVRATSECEILVIGREPFLLAVTTEQATVHNVAGCIDALDHSLGTWPLGTRRQEHD